MSVRMGIFLFFSRVRADGTSIYTDTEIYPLGNFKTDATVRLSHGRPSSHCPRPSVCLSILVRPLDNPASRDIII
jgi:hypothetical protein